MDPTCRWLGIDCWRYPIGLRAGARPGTWGWVPGSRPDRRAGPMTWHRVGRNPMVLLTAVVLFTAAAVGPATGSGLTDLDPVAGDGSGPASTAQLDRTPFARGVLDDGPAILGTPDHPVSPTVIGPIGDRLSTASDRVDTFDWGPPVALLLFGYTRQADAEPLEHDVRERVFDQVRSTPGAHIAAIVHETEIPRSTVRYHLRVLEDAGLVSGATIRGRHRYAPAGDDLELAAALHDEPTRAVLEAVGRFEPVSLTGLADEIGRAPSTVSHHLHELETAGLLRRESGNGRVEIRLDEVAVGFEQDRSAVVSEQGPQVETPAE